jgi:hypothetical protein
LGVDTDFAKEVQGRLVKLGCLDPPADGHFGPVSQLALAGFVKQAQLPASADTLTAKAADALLTAKPDTFIALKLGDDFASRIVKYMLLKNYFVARLPDFRTIVYVEGCDDNGTANRDEFDKWNDQRIVLDITASGKPRILFHAVCTTEPGRYYTEHPLNAMGAARIALEQFKAWRVGQHHPNNQPPSRHEALVQAGPIKIFRDKDKNGVRTGDASMVGSGFGINQHSGHDQSLQSIGKASAGCLVGRRSAEHREFMTCVKSDPRFKGNKGYMFMTAILPGDDLAKHFPVK